MLNFLLKFLYYKLQVLEIIVHELTSVKIRYQDADIESELNVCRNHFKEGIFQFSSNLPSNYIELRENKTSSFMESFYQRLAKILVSIILSILNSFFP